MSYKRESRYKKEILIEKIEWIELYSSTFGGYNNGELAGCDINVRKYRYPKLSFQLALETINNIQSHEHEEVGKFLEVYDEKTKTNGSIYIKPNRIK